MHYVTVPPPVLQGGLNNPHCLIAFLFRVMNNRE